MTTPRAAARYEAEHVAQYAGRKAAVYNPNDWHIDELPVVYGFNNGGSAGFLSAALIAEDGTPLGGHACSSEAYMYADLGILEDTRPDRHEYFKAHYPDGYRMAFVTYNEADNHAGLQAAIKKCKRRHRVKTWLDENGPDTGRASLTAEELLDLILCVMADEDGKA